MTVNDEDKVIQDFVAEGALLLGGGRAILMQLAHPDIARAIARHSAFDEHPERRLIHTLCYVYAVLAGTAEQRAWAIERVNAEHRPVRGSRNGRQAAYSARDPRLQLWVAATLYDSAHTLAQQVLPPLSPAAEESIYRFYHRLGSALQMPEQNWPESRSAFEEYLRATTHSLQVSEQARHLAKQLFAAQNAPWWIRVVMPTVRAVTIETLPPALTLGFGLRSTRATQRRARACLAGTRWATRWLPRRIRRIPLFLSLRYLHRTFRKVNGEQ